MPEVPFVFVSGTTRDLRSFRDAAREALLTGGAYPIVQEQFGPDYCTVAQKLRERISRCDAVICLVGFVFGTSPQWGTQGSEGGRRSYTQMEYDIARELNKPVFLFLADEECFFDEPDTPGPPDEPAELRQLQLDYRAELMARDELWTPFRTCEELRTRVAQLIPRLPSTKKRQPFHYAHRPKEPAYFRGRQCELDELDRAARAPTPTVVIILGLGGQGKTSLLYEWLKRNDPPDFDAGYWCTCSSEDNSFDQFLDDVLGYLLQGAFQKQACRSLAERVNMVVEELAKQRVLLVLDGLERWLKGRHLAGPERLEPLTDIDRSGYHAELDDLLLQSSGLSNGSHLVATTRARPCALDTARHSTIPVYEPGTLEGLEDTDALALLRAYGVRGSDPQLLHTANRHANHPMALEVVGTQVFKRYGGDITQIPRDSPLEYGNLSELLMAAREHLPDRKELERLLYVAALCIEDPPLWVLAAGLARDQSEQSKERLLDQVVIVADWQMLKWDGQVARIHPLIKDHFRRLPPALKHSENAAVIHARLSRFYSTLKVSKHARLLPDAKGRLLAIKHAHLAGDVAGSNRLLYSAFATEYSFAEWLIACGHLVTGIELLDMLAAAPAGDELAAGLRISRAAMRRWLGQLGKAKHDLDEAIALLNNRSPPTESRSGKLVAALNNRAGIHQQNGDLQRALRDYEEAIRSFPGRRTRAPDDSLVLVTLLVNRSRILRHVGRLGPALRAIRRAIRICEKTDAAQTHPTVATWAHAMWSQGNILADQGETAAALECFDRAVERYQALVNNGRAEMEPELAHIRGARGAMLRRMGRPHDAMQAIEESIGRLQTLVVGGRAEWEPCLALALIARAEVQGDLGDSNAAIDTCNQADAILRRLIKLQREDVEQARAYNFFVRATLLLPVDKNRSATDRAESLRILRDVGDQGANELRLALLFRLETSLDYLFQSEPHECTSLLHDVLDDVTLALGEPDDSERLERAVRQLLGWIRKRKGVLVTAGFDVGRLSAADRAMRHRDRRRRFQWLRRSIPVILRRMVPFQTENPLTGSSP